MSEDKGVRTQGRQAKIERHGLMDAALTLLLVHPKIPYKKIAEELNNTGLVPDDEKITENDVVYLTRSYPDVRRQVLAANRAAMRKLVMEGAEFDMLGTLRDMSARLMFMIDQYEEQTIESGELPDPTKYKALTSELREVLKQIEGIHKEIYDMEVVREFLVDVINVVKETSPQSLPAFIAKMKGKRESSHLVNELLKGGIK